GVVGMQFHGQRELAGCVVVVTVLHVKDAKGVVRLMRGRVQLGCSLEFRNGGRIIVLQLEGETEIVVKLEVLRIAFEAGAKDTDRFIDFVHLKVGSGQILMRGGIARLLLERAFKKRNGILRVPSKKKGQAQARGRLAVFRFGLDDLAKKWNGIRIVAAALQ